MKTLLSKWNTLLIIGMKKLPIIKMNVKEWRTILLNKIRLKLKSTDNTLKKIFP